MRQRVVRDERSDVPQLGRFGFQEFSPRRYRIKNIRYADRGPHRHPGRLHADQLAPGEFDAHPFGLFGVACFQHQPRNRSNRGQRLPAKSQGGYRKQIIGRAELRSRVPLEGQQRVIVVHSAAVVHHANQPFAARFRLDANRSRSGVNRVFEKLFYNRRGPFHNFASRNLISDILGKYADSAHRVCPGDIGF